MLTKERHDVILNILNQQGSVTVMDLVAELATSESTIRRDLVTLDKEGKLHKVHGGATAIEREFISGEYDVYTKSQLNMEEKRAIAQYAASTIQTDDFVFIDAGTTTEVLIDYITCNQAVYVTNGIVHAKKLIAKGLKTYVIGGQLKPVTEALIGAEGINSMKKYNFTKSFLGTNGVHLDRGFTTVDVEEAMIKAEAVNRSFVSYILADHTKFDKYTAVEFAPINRCCIVTDYVTKEEYINATNVKEVKRQ